MEWWLWCIFGCVLLMLELVVPGGFVFLFFGLGALLTGAIVSTGVLPEAWAQWLAFSGGSALALVFFRAKLKAILELRETPAPDIDSTVGLVGSAVSDIAAGEIGQVEVRGAHWTARNVGQGAITTGKRCVVHQVDGLVLMVKPE